jgi:protein ImuA
VRSAPEVLHTLTQRIRALETSLRPQGRSTLALGIPFFGDLLPEGELPAGSLVELLATAEGAGAWTLALLLTRHACGERKALVIVDPRSCFYPPAASRLGIDLAHTIVVRPTTHSELHAALDQSLRCQAVGTVLGGCERLRAAESQRLKLAAEAGGGLGILLRPGGASSGPSFADLRMTVTPLSPEKGTGTVFCPRRMRLDVMRCRGGRSGQSLVLEIDDETGHVRLPAELASPAIGTQVRAAQ